MKTATVTEYVLYRGTYDNPDKQPLFSHEDRSIVELHRLDEVRKANGVPIRLSVSKRVCTYPVHPESGAKLAKDSTCEETEVTGS